MSRSLVETTDYDEPGSWGKASDGWPGVRGDEAYDMFVFANCIESIPYGFYVLMSQKDRYDATESYIRVHADYIDQLKADFKSCGSPSAQTSIDRREKYGKKRSDGLRESAPMWKV